MTQARPYDPTLTARMAARVPAGEAAFRDELLACGSVAELGEVLAAKVPDDAALIPPWMRRVVLTFIDRDRPPRGHAVTGALWPVGCRPLPLRFRRRSP